MSEATDAYKENRAAGELAYDLLVRLLHDHDKITREFFDCEYQARYGELPGDARTPGSMGRRRGQALLRYRRKIERKVATALTDEEAQTWREKRLEWVPTQQTMLGGGYYKRLRDLLPWEWDAVFHRYETQIKSLQTKLERLREDQKLIEERSDRLTKVR